MYLRVVVVLLSLVCLASVAESFFKGHLPRSVHGTSTGRQHPRTSVFPTPESEVNPADLSRLRSFYYLFVTGVGGNYELNDLSY